MTSPTACGCGRPIADQAYLCQRCSERLERDLGDVNAYSQELQTTRLRQSRTGNAGIGVVSRSHDKPLPWDQHAAECADALHAALVGWVRVVVDERGLTVPADTDEALAALLLRHLDWMRHQPFAHEAADELGDAVSRSRNAVDIRGDRLYAGPCDPTGEHDQDEDGNPRPCTADLYARPDAEQVVCQACGLVWDVTSRRDYLIEAAQHQLVTAVDLSRFLTAYGQPLTAERIRQWAARDQLVAHGHDSNGRPLYRVSEAADLLARMTIRRSA